MLHVLASLEFGAGFNSTLCWAHVGGGRFPNKFGARHNWVERLFKTRPRVRPCRLVSGRPWPSTVLKSLSTQSRLIQWSGFPATNDSICCNPKFEFRLVGHLSKNVVGHGWPERSAQGCACSGFWKGAPQAGTCTKAPEHAGKRRTPKMDANSLKAFLSIVDQGSFSEAAEALHLTQPAISKRLAALENQLGTKLIERGHREIRVTEAGARLLPHARRILDEIHNARMALSADDGIISGELEIIASHHIGLHHLPNWLRRFVSGYPEVTVNLQFMESDAAYSQMLKRNAELAFVTLSDSMGSEFVVYEQWSDPMAFVVGAGHELAVGKNASLEDLAQYPALLPDTTTATYRAVSRLFLEANLPLKQQIPTNYLETIKMMASVGLGWSVLPVSMVDESLHQLDTGFPVSRVLGAVGLSGRHLSPAATALLGIVHDEEANQTT